MKALIEPAVRIEGKAKFPDKTRTLRFKLEGHPLIAYVRPLRYFDEHRCFGGRMGAWMWSGDLHILVLWNNEHFIVEGSASMGRNGTISINNKFPGWMNGTTQRTIRKLQGSKTLRKLLELYPVR